MKRVITATRSIRVFVKTDNLVPFHYSKQHLVTYIQSISSISVWTNDGMTKENKHYDILTTMGVCVCHGVSCPRVKFLNGTNCQVRNMCAYVYGVTSYGIVSQKP